MDEKKFVITIKDKNIIFINNLNQKYSNSKNIKIAGKILHYLQTTIFHFYLNIFKSSDINPFSSNINMSFEFIDNYRPYARILNDFINPSLNDGRNIFYCLTNNHNYIFKKDNLDVFSIILDEMISGIENFLYRLKENIQISTFIYYGEYEIDHIYQINDFIIDKNTVKFFRIIQITNKNEKMKFIIITQLYLLIFTPINDDMSLAKLEKWFYFKDIDFSLDEIIINKKNINRSHFLKIFNKITHNLIEIEFVLFFDEQIEYNEHNKYAGFRNVLLGKKNEIDLKKYKIIITNYKPLFTIEIKKNNKMKKSETNMYNDYKLYIEYFEELYNYFKDFKEEKIQKRVKKYLAYLTFFCVEFISFYDANNQEVKFYQSKMAKYLNPKDI